MYLSYLMGGEDIADEELTGLGIEIVGTTDDGHRKLHIPESAIEQYKILVREKMAPT